MIQCFLRQITLIITAFTLIACSGNSTSGRKTDTFFVHGDPLAIIKDTQRNTLSPFSPSTITSFSNFNLAHVVIFQESSEKENPKSELVTLNKFSFSSYSTTTDTYYIYSDPAADPAITYKLFFKQTGSAINLYQINDFEVEVLHYSVTPTRDRFSILCQYSNAGGRVMMALFFTKNFGSSIKYKELNEDYDYILGPGNGANWTTDINVSLCGAMSSSDEADLKLGIDNWGGEFYSIQVTVDRRLGHPPFSDVNVNCVKIISEYLFEDTEEEAVLAITIPIINLTTGSIVNAPIIFSESGFVKTLNSTNFQGIPRDIFLRYISLHEFGHFLGLNHEFDKDSSGNPIYSVMSYEYRNIDDPTPRIHDWNALDELYKP